MIRRYRFGLLSALLAFLLLLSCTAGLAESQSPPELPVDVDLTLLSGNPLLDRLSEIRANPADWQSLTLRVRGQYYGQAADDGVQHSLIVCDTCQCAEVGITLIPADGVDISWPANHDIVEVIARVEPYETVYGTVFARLAVLSLVCP